MTGRFLTTPSETHGSFCTTPRDTHPGGTLWQCECAKIYEARTVSVWRGRELLLGQDLPGRPVTPPESHRCASPRSGRYNPADDENVQRDHWRCSTCGAVWRLVPYTYWNELRKDDHRLALFREPCNPTPG